MGKNLKGGAEHPGQDRVNDPTLRDRLVVNGLNGLNIDGVHVNFVYHAKKNDLTRVLVSKLPVGVSNEEILLALDYYSDILSVQQVTKVMFGKRLGPRSHLQENSQEYPSYVPVRGWKTL